LTLPREQARRPGGDGGVMWESTKAILFATAATEVMSLALDESLRRSLAVAQRALEERVALARKLYQ
jgi:hypothetical protein